METVLNTIVRTQLIKLLRSIDCFLVQMDELMHSNHLFEV